jgi:hypothetical protein
MKKTQRRSPHSRQMENSIYIMANQRKKRIKSTTRNTRNGAQKNTKYKKRRRDLPRK